MGTRIKKRAEKSQKAFCKYYNKQHFRPSASSLFQSSVASQAPILPECRLWRRSRHIFGQHTHRKKRKETRISQREFPKQNLYRDEKTISTFSVANVQKLICKTRIFTSKKIVKFLFSPTFFRGGGGGKTQKSWKSSRKSICISLFYYVLLIHFSLKKKNTIYTFWVFSQKSEKKYGKTFIFA